MTPEVIPSFVFFFRKIVAVFRLFLRLWVKKHRNLFGLILSIHRIRVKVRLRNGRWI